ncbi:hypothetical protein NPIL_71211, partial [Nephila pilipes]
MLNACLESMQSPTDDELNQEYILSQDISRKSFRRAARDYVWATKRKYRKCYECVQDVCAYLRRKTDNIRNSGYFSVIPFILLLLPGSAVYMGVANIYRCPGSPETPIQVTILGLLGCLVLILRVVNLILRANGNVSSEPLLIVITASSSIAIFSFLMAEIITFLNISPDFDSSS